MSDLLKELKEEKESKILKEYCCIDASKSTICKANEDDVKYSEGRIKINEWIMFMAPQTGWVEMGEYEKINYCPFCGKELK